MVRIHSPGPLEFLKSLLVRRLALMASQRPFPSGVELGPNRVPEVRTRRRACCGRSQPACVARSTRSVRTRVSGIGNMPIRSPMPLRLSILSMELNSRAMLYKRSSLIEITIDTTRQWGLLSTTRVL